MSKFKINVYLSVATFLATMAISPMVLAQGSGFQRALPGGVATAKTQKCWTKKFGCAGANAGVKTKSACWKAPGCSWGSPTDPSNCFNNLKAPKNKCTAPKAGFTLTPVPSQTLQLQR